MRSYSSSASRGAVATSLRRRRVLHIRHAPFSAPETLPPLGLAGLAAAASAAVFIAAVAVFAAAAVAAATAVATVVATAAGSSPLYTTHPPRTRGKGGERGRGERGRGERDQGGWGGAARCAGHVPGRAQPKSAVRTAPWPHEHVTPPPRALMGLGMLVRVSKILCNFFSSWMMWYQTKPFNLNLRSKVFRRPG